MISSYNNENKRIAKNTFLLYIRMLFSALVSLYTTRVVLNALGVEDYGIYNVVAGFVSLLAVVNSSMVSATRRYLTIAITSDDLKYRKSVFSTSFYIHAGITVFIVFIAIVLGFYFLNNELNIPDDRKDVATWVFITSMTSVMSLCITVPHNALVVAYEKMGTFAFLSIIEVVLKLFIAIIIGMTQYDRLFLYSTLLCVVSIMVRLLYVVYCHRKFYDDVCYSFFKRNWVLTKEMLQFAGWNMFSSVSLVASNQGINVLLNLFFNPMVNAARGIAVQIQGFINLLAVNFLQAVNPQITKSYALHDLGRMQQLIFFSVKVSFFLMSLLSFPIIIEAAWILKLWLVEYPDFTVSFVRLLLCVVLLDVITNPITTAVLSNGDIRTYQLVTSVLQLSVIPISYVSLKLGSSPESVFIISLAVTVIMGCYKVNKALALLKMSRLLFLRKVLIPILLVSGLMFCIYALYFYMFGYLATHLINIILSILLLSSLVVAFGLSSNEREYMFNILKSKIKSN